MLCLYPVGLLIGNEREVTAGEYRRDNDKEHHDKDDATLILAMVRSFHRAILCAQHSSFASASFVIISGT